MHNRKLLKTLAFFLVTLFLTNVIIIVNPWSAIRVYAASEDTTPPNITSFSATSTENSITVSGSASDAGSGLAPSPYRFNIGNQDSGLKAENVVQSTTNIGYPLSSIPSFVTNSAYDISGNGGRKVTMLLNGWIVCVAYDNSTNNIRMFVSKDNGQTWSLLAVFLGVTTPSYSICSYGNKVYIISSTASVDGSVYFYCLDATTFPPGGLIGMSKTIDVSQNSIGNGLSLVCDPTNGYLYAAWCSKNNSFPNSFNIRYAMSKDGGTTWNTANGSAGVDQITNTNDANIQFTNPCIVVRNGKPVVVYQQAWAGTANYIRGALLNGIAWDPSPIIYNSINASYAQTNPCATVSPNGRIWCTWRGKDPTDSAVYNIHIKYSDDGGQSWVNGNGSTDKLTSGNTLNRHMPSICSDKDSNLSVLVEGNLTDSVTWGIYKIVFTNSNNSWGSMMQVSTSNNNTSPQVIENVKDFFDPLVIWTDNSAQSIRFTGKLTSWVDPVLPTAVAGSAYDISGNGGRKIVRLSNGWFVITAYNSSNTTIYFYVSKDNGNTWQQLTYITRTTDGGFAITSFGNNIYLISSYVTAGVFLNRINATTVSNVNQNSLNQVTLEPYSVNGSGGVSIECDQSTGYLYAAWSSKNTTYPNSFNVRASFSKDGGTTWRKCDDSGVGIDQVSTYNNTTNLLNPCLVIKNSKPSIIYQYDDGTTYYGIECKVFNGTSWLGGYTVFSINRAYTQSNSCAVVSPDGNIHVCWNGRDATDPNIENIRYSKSTDGGITWSAMAKLTSGNSYHQYNPVITSDKNNNIYVVWQGADSTNSFYQYIKKIIWNGSIWSSVNVLVNGSSNQRYPQLCSNYTDFTDPLCIWQDTQAGAIKFRGSWGTTKTADATYSSESPLTPNTPYIVKFQASDKVGNTATTSKEVYTKAVVPTLSIVSSSANTSDITIKDTNPDNTQYQITSSDKYVTQTGTLSAVPSWITLMNKKIRVTGLSSGADYSFTIKARNGEGVETATSGEQKITLQTPPLPAPAGVSITALSESKIRITWKPVTGAAGYKVEKDGDSTNLIDTGTNLYFEDTGLAAGSTHKYRVSAKGNSSLGNWSIYVSAKTKTPPPIAPKTVTLVPHGTSVEISWTEVANVTGYDIEIDGGIKPVGKKLTYINTGLKTMSQHTYRVRSKNLIGAGDWSTLQTVMTTDGLPGTPTKILSSVTNRSVYISWTPAMDAETYEVCEMLDGQEGPTINVGSGSIFEDRGLAPSSSHTYKIRAINSSGLGDWCDPIAVSTCLLDTPLNIRTTKTQDSITITWDAVQDATSYEISANNQITSNITVNSYTISSLTPETKYTVSVRAKNSQGESGWSNATTVATLPVKPTIPANVSAIVTDTTINMKWDAVASAEGYDVELDGVILENDNATTYIHDELGPNAVHTYRVRARNAAIEGDWSPLQSIRTLPGQPKVPTVIVLKSTQTGATISWNGIDGATGYDLEIFDGTSTTVVENITDTSYTHRRIAPLVECRYRLRTRNLEGVSEWSGYIINNAIKANCKKSNSVDLGLTSTDVVDFSKYTLVVTYNPGVIDVTDLCGLSGTQELATGKVEGTDITITEFTPGRIVFTTDKAVNPGESWTGVINNIKFKAKVTGGTTITYTVFCKVEE